ncbi:TPA: hypothetical protein N3A08_005081 [Salmonella enterica subsp. salamae serovar 9,46:z4,z24:z39:z42]|nr:hypothetical protein [Salmonella enterica subsp. salamae serovar 9,46:z4,z24:z39:z42]HCM1955900.1 hypothetical protein [Salmonella enterica subsp. salamae serovar 9,46:z4,z24:z39:z42]
MMNWTEFVIKPGLTLLSGAITGLVVAFFTARYALARFYKEKWWEKKLTAFLEVTEYIYKIKRAEDYWFAQAESMQYQDETFQALSKEEEEDLRSEYVKGMKELTRISHLSSFTLSKKTSQILGGYIVEHDKIYPSWWQDEIDSFEASERSQILINTLLESILVEAKRELKLKG